MPSGKRCRFSLDPPGAAAWWGRWSRNSAAGHAVTAACSPSAGMSTLSRLVTRTSWTGHRPVPLALQLIQRLQLGAAGGREVHLGRWPCLLRGRHRRPAGGRTIGRRRALAGRRLAAGARCTTRAAGTASSRTTSAGSRSSSIPLKAAWRSSPSRVQSVNSARITIRGSTQRASGSRGVLTSGASSAGSAPWPPAAPCACGH